MSYEQVLNLTITGFFGVITTWGVAYINARLRPPKPPKRRKHRTTTQPEEGD